MNEASKSKARMIEKGEFGKFVKGRILDIGCGEDKITPEAVGWDLPDGDAQKLETLEDKSFDTVYSSHCLEHMRDPLEALLNWWRVLKPGGMLIVAIPDEDLYEQGIYPSAFNPDHKWTFSISKDESWSPRHKNVIDLIKHLPGHRVVYLRTVDTGYDYTKGVEDQTLLNAEAQIEFVVEKVKQQPQLRTNLTRLFLCPQCKEGRIITLGVTKNNTLDVLCEGCGVRLEVRLA